MLSYEDRVAITDVINLHGHYADAGELERMAELFTDDVVYDVSDLGFAPINGRAALSDAALALGDKNPLGHHVTNIVVSELSDDEARVLSKAIAIMTGGSCGSATYEDTVVRTGAGWRISHRRVLARRRPLTASGHIPDDETA